VPRWLACPLFYTCIASPRFGTFAVDVNQECSECQRGLRILQDRTEVFGTGGRRLWTECPKFGREREVTSLAGHGAMP
jgi:hypothetical protein